MHRVSRKIALGFIPVFLVAVITYWRFDSPPMIIHQQPVVADEPDVSKIPTIEYRRTILRPFHLRWTSKLHKKTEGGDSKVVCVDEDRGAFMTPSRVLPNPITLAWWFDYKKDCKFAAGAYQIEAGVYQIETVLSWKDWIWWDSITLLSNDFRIGPPPPH